MRQTSENKWELKMRRTSENKWEFKMRQTSENKWELKMSEILESDSELSDAASNVLWTTEHVEVEFEEGESCIRC